MTPLRTIILLATGGTIASTSPDSSSLAEYDVTEGAESLIAAVPGIEKLANIRCEQLCNVKSYAIDNAILLQMAARINTLLADPAVDGVVVTHGTDTLEESAYFLNLTVKSPKPVVIVGAMRPGSAISADGPLNLYNAVLLASHPEVRDQGVMVVLNDSVHAARYVSKTHTTAVETFQSRDQGCIGHVYNNRVYLFQSVAPAHTTQTPFDVSGLDALPWVDIIYDYQNAGIHHYQASIAAGAQGIVIAGCGNGNLSPLAQEGARLAFKAKVPCVRSTRTGSGIITPSDDDASKGLVSADSLNPQKARILLMLALGLGSDLADIQALFYRY